jgi:hypothetical protein
MYAHVYIRPDIEIAVGLLGQYNIVEYTRNQELKIHLPLGSVYSGLIFAKCVNSRKSTSIKRRYTEDAVSILQLLKAKIITCYEFVTQAI